MGKIDARKLSTEELIIKRELAIKLRKDGIPNKEVAEITGISPQTISLYYSRYKKNDPSIFNIKDSGPKKKVWFLKKCPIPNIEI